MLNCAELTKKIGHVVAFVGNESAPWGDQDFVNAAHNCRALGIDTLAIKAFDGLNRWYSNPQALRTRCQKINAAGCGVIPWGYCYGPKFGTAQIDGECILLQEAMLESGGYAMADMEVEWNNATSMATHFVESMKPRKRATDVLLVTTWGDPIQQNWTQVITGLNPIVDVWVPQMYTNWLATQEQQLINLHAHCIQPALDVLGDFGSANNPAYAEQQAKQHGDTTIWLWDYVGIRSATALIKDFTAGNVKPKYAPSAAVALPAPTPAAVKSAEYIVTTGEDLASIAKKLGLPNWFQDLYLPNKVALEAAAKKHGLASSNQGHLIYPGQSLTYTKH